MKCFWPVDQTVFHFLPKTCISHLKSHCLRFCIVVINSFTPAEDDRCLLSYQDGSMINAVGKTYVFWRQDWSSQLYTQLVHYIPVDGEVQIIIRSFIYSLAFFTIYGYIMNSQHDQLPVGLIAQLVEHCTGIAEVMGLNPVQAWIFFRL